MLEGDPGKSFMSVGVGGKFPRGNGSTSLSEFRGEVKFDPKVLAANDDCRFRQHIVDGGAVTGVRPRCELFSWRCDKEVMNSLYCRLLWACDVI